MEVASSGSNDADSAQQLLLLVNEYREKAMVWGMILQQTRIQLSQLKETARHPSVSTRSPSGTAIYLTLLNASLAVITQSAGRVCGPPEQLGILLRSSPIVAIADTTLHIEAIIVEAVRAKSVRSAIGTILNRRFEEAGSHKSERYILPR